ncbi:hypothetical protein O181_104209 [Austropuccinia psidii MF-1]|uniref:Uncharacterized protein n=1 Tax=Austropuccinia psidii MF-1 TaxID=1389203 RepID=A0A9Q3JLZ9_9BASI|nr:hypothetical protein [Austropuccinia psidii MF-1]
MSESMINIKIVRKCGGELKNAIKCRCVEPRSPEDCNSTMEDIITRKRICNIWIRKSIETKINPKISRQDKKPVLKCHKCGRTSHLANTFIKKTKINEVKVIENFLCSEAKEESDQDYAVCENIPVEDYCIENIKAFFEVTEVHTHLLQYSEYCYNLINIQDSRMCNTKPARGKGYTAGASCLTSALMKDVQVKVNLDTGKFCPCISKGFLQIILPEWRNHLLPIECVQFSSTSNNIYPLGILDTNLVFSQPAGRVRMKT